MTNQRSATRNLAPLGSTNTSARKQLALAAALVSYGLTLGCRAPQTTPAAAPPPPPPPPPATVSPMEGAAPAPLPAAQILKGVGFETPESVLYDPVEDVYLVSNISGAPTEADLNGFISKVSPTGEVLQLKFIDGAKPGSWLNAPKGMAFGGDTLYVADITFVRLFDRKTGEPKGKIGVGGATFVNDISVAPDGTIYVTDTGWRGGAKGLENSGTDAIFSIDPKNVSAKELIKDTKLGNPNGIYADDAGVWVASGVGTLYHVDKNGKLSDAQSLPAKGLDGIVSLPDSSLLVTSWDAKTVYRGKPGGEFAPLLTEITSPADIGYDEKRNRVLIPVFLENEVRIQELSANEPSEATPAPAAESAPAASAPPPAAPATAAPATPPPPATQTATQAAKLVPSSKSSADSKR